MDIRDLPRVRLRAVRPGDAERLYFLVRDPDVLEHTLIPRPYRRRHAADFIKQARRLRRLKKEHHLAVVLPGTGKVVGMVALAGSLAEGGTAVIGYWIGKAYWRRGLAGAAVEGALRLGFERLGVARVSANVFPENRASARVLERAGFRRGQLLRRKRKVFGKWRDEVPYGLTRERWRALRTPAVEPNLHTPRRP